MLACDLAASTSGLGRGGDVPVEQFSGCSRSRLAEVQRQRFLIVTSNAHAQL